MQLLERSEEVGSLETSCGGSCVCVYTYSYMYMIMLCACVLGFIITVYVLVAM